MLNLLKKQIKCAKTISLIKKAIKIGYAFEGKKFMNKLGVPSENILSPILSNIYLNCFDNFIQNLIEKIKIKKRKKNLKYKKTLYMLSKAQTLNKKQEILVLRKQLKQLLSKDKMSLNVRRICFCRYGSTFIIGVVGSLKIAKLVFNDMNFFLKQSLKLELDLKKTKLISFKNKIDFLGIQIKNDFKKKKYTSSISFNAPIIIIFKKLIQNKFLKRNKKGILRPQARGDLVNLDHIVIINYYNSIIHELMNYFNFVDNRKSMKSVVNFLKHSCALTLALKYKLRTRAKVFKKFGKLLADPQTNICLIMPTNFRCLRHDIKFQT